MSRLQVNLARRWPWGQVSGGAVLGVDMCWTAPETYCVSHECSLQNMPERLITVTPQGIQVVPAMNQRKASCILKGNMMESEKKVRGPGGDRISESS